MREKIISPLYVVLSIVLFISLVTVQNVQASSTDYKEMQTTTYRFLQYVKEGHDLAAISAFEELKRKSMDQSVLPKKLTHEEWRTLMKETKSALSDEEVTSQEKYHRALTVVLLYDAIWNENDDALWVTWKNHLEEKIKSSFQGNDMSQGSLNQLYTLYERLLPALKVSLSEEQYRKMQDHQRSFLSFLSGERKQGQKSFINALAQDLQTIPAEEKEKKSFTEEPGFIWSLFSVGGLIISTLIYVGWRKYRGESESKSKEEEKERGS